MHTNTYAVRRTQLENYFDRTAAEAWSRLTSDAPVSRIRATVRAGRDRMRATLLDWLPSDLRGARVLDAGCGTGALTIAAAQRGAHVVAVDVAGSLVGIARQRVPADLDPARLEFIVGDMLDPALGVFDYVVAMDSLIHYAQRDMIRITAELAGRTSHSLLLTFAPRTTALALMHAVGRLFPRGNRAPAIEPVSEIRLCRQLEAERALAGWELCRTERVASGFYTSQALELVRR